MKDRAIEQAFKKIGEEINDLKAKVNLLELDRCAKGNHGPLGFYDAHGRAKKDFGGYVRFICKNCNRILQVGMGDKLHKFFESPELLRAFEEQPIA